MRRLVQFSIVIVCIFSLSGFAGRIWHHSLVGEQTGRKGLRSAIAMRTGQTWPTVAYGGPGSVDTLTPAGWISSPFTVYGAIDGASAPNGNVGFADELGNINMLTKTGWSNHNLGFQLPSYQKPSIAFNQNSQPAVLFGHQYDLTLATFSGNGWFYSEISSPDNHDIQTGSYALAFDSLNQANVAFIEGRRLYYAVKGPLTGNEWIISDPFENNGQWNQEIPNASYLDMAMTANDIPYVVYQDDRYLKYATFDPQTASWTYGQIAQLEFGDPDDPAFTLKADSKGGLGLVYKQEIYGQDGNLIFAYNDGTSGWISEVIGQAEWDSDVGLTFDENDFPVVTYGDREGQLWMAYDPIVVPEPASMAALLAGVFFIRKRS